MIIKMRTIVIFFCVALSVISCTDRSSQSASDYSDALIILKNASNVKYHKLNGTDQVSYKLFTKYPAKDTISELNNRLKIKGWEFLKKDLSLDELVGKLEYVAKHGKLP